ncbi:MAG: DoxX family protein [Pyrinomonadaceae bacterium]
MNSLLHPLSRFLVALIFIMSGTGKIFGFAGTAGMMGKIGFPVPEFFLICAIFIEIVGGLMLLLGFKTRIGALMLIIFLITATVIFHASGIGDPVKGQDQMIQTLKNIAILGALVKFLADGAGAYALDSWLVTRPVNTVRADA